MVFRRRTDCRLPSRSVVQLFAHPRAMRTTGSFRPHRAKLFDHVPCAALACQVFQVAAGEVIQARVSRRRDASSFRDDLIVGGQRDFHGAHIARVRTACQRPTAASSGTRCRGSRFRVMPWTWASGRSAFNERVANERLVDVAGDEDDPRLAVIAVTGEDSSFPWGPSRPFRPGQPRCNSRRCPPPRPRVASRGTPGRRHPRRATARPAGPPIPPTPRSCCI